MKIIIFLFAFYCSAFTLNTLAYELPINALSYGLMTPQHAAEDPVYGGNTASTDFNICLKGAMTGGQANACYSDEIYRIERDIDSLMNTIFDSKTVPNDAKINYINQVKTDLNRINYFCDIFKITSSGKKNDDSNSIEIGMVYGCRINRLNVLRSAITRAVNEL
ncbi:hypothetical protein ZD68_06095 [Salmonella enterica subsp. enterica serovar Brandenburg]|nr:hypothetical protein [Salmonella enterica subsp. enterica serovar Brandenburg]